MTRARDLANLVGSGNFSSTTFTATAGQTAFTISHTQGFVQVFMNGLLLDETADYTSNGTAITLTSGASVGDEIEVVAYNTFSVGDGIAASGGTFTGAVIASDGLTVDDDGATPLTVDRATSDGDIIAIQKNGSTVGSIGTGSGSELAISTTSGTQYISQKLNGDTDGLQYSNSGTYHFGPWLSKDNAVDLGRSNGRFKDVYLSGGVYLGGTGAANKIDDYEEGTWSGSVGAVSGNTQPSVAGGTFTGSYTKVGRVVHVAFYCGPFQMSGTLSSTMAIKGMPFAHGGGDSTNGGVVSTYYITWARPNYVALRIYSGNEAGFLSVNNGYNWGWEDCNAAGTGANRYISGTLQYTVA